jgi:hypothetical protein
MGAFDVRRDLVLSGGVEAKLLWHNSLADQAHVDTLIHDL